MFYFVRKIFERNSILQDQTFLQDVNNKKPKKKNDQQSTGENVSEGLISPIAVRDPCPLNQDDEVAGPSRPKSPRIENSLLENLRTSLKEEITSEIKNLLVESQKEMLRLLKPEMRGNVRDNTEEEVEEETRSFYTPTKSVRISSTQNDPIICRNRQFLEPVTNSEITSLSRTMSSRCFLLLCFFFFLGLKPNSLKSPRSC